MSAFSGFSVLFKFAFKVYERVYLTIVPLYLLQEATKMTGSLGLHCIFRNEPTIQLLPTEILGLIHTRTHEVQGVKE